MLSFFNFEKMSNDLLSLQNNQGLISFIILVILSFMFSFMMTTIYYKFIKKRDIFGDDSSENKPVINLKKLKEAITL